MVLSRTTGFQTFHFFSFSYYKPKCFVKGVPVSSRTIILIFTCMSRVLESNIKNLICSKMGKIVYKPIKSLTLRSSCFACCVRSLSRSAATLSPNPSSIVASPGTDNGSGYFKRLNKIFKISALG